jgi:hypothetical protein
LYLELLPPLGLETGESAAFSGREIQALAGIKLKKS